jgi:hypothetical protein
VLTLVLAAALAAAPTRPVAVVATSKRPGADAYTQRTAERVQLALLREAVPGLLPLDDAMKQLKAMGITDPRTCQAGRACVAKLAEILGTNGVVISVDTAKAGNSLLILLEAIGADGARVLANSQLTLPVDKESDEAALPIIQFARKLKDVLDAEAPKPVAEVTPKPDDAPTKPNLEPPPPPPLVTASPKAGPAKAVGGVLVGAAAASGATAIVLAIVSGTAKAEYDASLSADKSTSALAQSRIDDLQGRANGGATGALVAGISAVALGVVGVILLAGN